MTERFKLVYNKSVCDYFMEDKESKYPWHISTVEGLLNSFDDTQKDLTEEVSELEKENEQLKEENNKLHQKIFEMRTNIALERTEISRQTYTGKKNEKEYLSAKEFLDEIEKW